MTEYNKFKLFLIYCYEFYEENDAKLFNEITTHSLEYPHKFHEHTEQENNIYLENWKKQNNIKLGDFEMPRKFQTNKYGTPIYIKRIRGTFHKCNFDGGDDRTA